MKSNVLQVAAVLLCLPFLYALDYDEIRQLNASCSPKDTCSKPRDLDNPIQHNCDCSSLCALYDTCCIDSQFLNITRQYKQSHAVSCKPTGEPGQNVFMIDTCLDSYRNSTSVRRRCEHKAKDWSDPFNNIPVTNPESQKTYKSLFCAICNDENPRRLSMWQVALDCSSLNESMELCIDNSKAIIKNMVYIREKGIWGIWLRDSESKWQFKHLPINYSIPPRLKKSVMNCRPNVISNCAARWKHAKTKRLCNSYMGTVFYDDIVFRNIHCAVCNYITNVTHLSCHEKATPYRISTTMSFGILLDMDLSDGNTVGTVDPKCETNQVYDPFAKICRDIVCALPGTTLKDGKCVQE